MTIPDDAEVTQLPDDAEQQNEVEEHQGDKVVLEGVRFRLDGTVYCSSQDFEIAIGSMEDRGANIGPEHQEQIDRLRAMGGEEVAITMSCYVNLDVHYDPTSSDITQVAGRAAEDRANEIIGDPQQTEWWYNDEDEGWQLGELLNRQTSILKPRRFKARKFQVYNYDKGTYGGVGLSEFGSLQ